MITDTTTQKLPTKLQSIFCIFFKIVDDLLLDPSYSYSIYIIYEGYYNLSYRKLYYFLILQINSLRRRLKVNKTQLNIPWGRKNVTKKINEMVLLLKNIQQLLIVNINNFNWQSQQCWNVANNNLNIPTNTHNHIINIKITTKSIIKIN